MFDNVNQRLEGDCYQAGLLGTEKNNDKLVGLAVEVKSWRNWKVCLNDV